MKSGQGRPPTQVTGMMSLVPTVGLEPTRLAPLPPQDSVSTNSTTSAWFSVARDWASVGLLSTDPDQPPPAGTWGTSAGRAGAAGNTGSGTTGAVGTGTPTRSITLVGWPVWLAR